MTLTFHVFSVIYFVIRKCQKCAPPGAENSINPCSWSSFMGRSPTPELSTPPVVTHPNKTPLLNSKNFIYIHVCQNHNKPPLLLRWFLTTSLHWLSKDPSANKCPRLFALGAFFLGTDTAGLNAISDMSKSLYSCSAVLQITWCSKVSLMLMKRYHFAYSGSRLPSPEAGTPCAIFFAYLATTGW